MKVEQLAPITTTRPKTPQCFAQVAEPSGATRPDWRVWQYGRRGTDPGRCQLRSVVMIDGKPWCARHGGQLALAHLLGALP